MLTLLGFRVQLIKNNCILIIKCLYFVTGIGALYNGLRPTVVRTIPATATLFVVYEYSKKVLHNLFN